LEYLGEGVGDQAEGDQAFNYSFRIFYTRELRLTVFKPFTRIQYRMEAHSSTEVEFMKQMTDRGLTTTQTPQENTVVSAADTATEMQTLKEIIVAWREAEREVSSLSAQIREKKKKQKTMEEVILRIMKKNNIGALDLKGSGGRLLYRKHTTKGTLNVKTLTEMLTTHLKSDTAAAEALKFINEHRGAKTKESLMYERALE
jgi:hypothetical protein